MKHHLLTLILTFLFLASPITVAQAAVSMTLSEHQAAMGLDMQNIDKYTYQQTEAFESALGTQIGSSKVKGLSEGVIPQIGKVMTAMIVTPPFSSGEYLADVFRNTKLTPQAYAQGIGFAGLSPVLKIWKAFRNLTYFAFIVVFVVVGFMIMFRKKVSSNSIVTIQEALPKIIVTLLLITFSYAIAGFVVDLIYLSIYIVTALFQSFGIFNPGGAATARDLIFGKNIISLGFSLLVGTEEVGGEAAQAVTSVLNEALGGWGGIISWISTPLTYLIIVVAMVIALFRTFFALVTSYVGLILSTILAPIQLLPNAFPGNDSFAKWARGLIANAAVFPIVATMVFLGAALVGGKSNTSEGDNIFPIQENIGWFNGSTSQGWVPPLISGGNNSETGANAIRTIIGLGIILLLPEVVKIVKEALQVKENYGEMALKNAQAGWGGLNATGNKLFGKSQTEKLDDKGWLRKDIPGTAGLKDYLPNNIKGKVGGGNLSTKWVKWPFSGK